MRLNKAHVVPWYQLNEIIGESRRRWYCRHWGIVYVFM